MEVKNIDLLQTALESALLTQSRRNRDYKLLVQIRLHFREDGHKDFFSKPLLIEKNREFEALYLSRMNNFIDFLSDDDFVFYNKEVQADKHSFLISLERFYKILENESGEVKAGVLFLLKDHEMTNLHKHLRQIDELRVDALNKYNNFYSHAKNVL